MVWNKRGIIWRPSDANITLTHAMIPTPILIEETKTIRIYFSMRDNDGKGLPFYVEVDAENPKEIKSDLHGPLLELGKPGRFDSNGVVACSIVNVTSNETYMYYVGFEIPNDVRYRMFTGLAISYDAGKTFEKYSEIPILDRVDGEALFRCGPFAILEDGVFKLWYIAGGEWTNINGKESPLYNLRYLESRDGKNWPKQGVTILEPSEDNYGFGRPWLYNDGESTSLIISARKKHSGKYELENYKLDKSKRIATKTSTTLPLGSTQIDNEMISYASVIEFNDKKFCFYNGNNFGEEGICLAEFS